MRVPIIKVFHSSITSSHLGPIIFRRALLSVTFSLCSFVSMRGQVSHPHRITGKIRVLYIFNLHNLGELAKRQNMLHWMMASILWLQSALSFLNCKFSLLGMFPSIWTVAPFQRICYLSLCYFVLQSVYKTWICA